MNAETVAVGFAVAVALFFLAVIGCALLDNRATR